MPDAVASPRAILVSVFDSCACPQGSPSMGSPAGDTAAVIEVGSPPVAYEIEVVDAPGHTLWWVR